MNATANGNGSEKLVTVEIDGRRFQVEGGRNMLDVSLSLGFDLPYFCWHPAMGSIGACRQCAVRQHWVGRDGKEHSEIVMACMTEAAEGTRIVVDDPEAVRFRARMIELMMVSHPHDCPVCDEGGECHLQDMTVMTGHAYRRYRSLKRTAENQDLGPFVTHEMNRCITCYRCVRFYNDYAGGRDFGVFGLRNQTYFGRVSDGTLESEFSGNLVEVCPTGVFDDKTLAQHYTRKWDLQTAPSLCPLCGLGCNVLPGERYGELRRVRARYNADVNQYFLCDRGRYGYEFVNSAERVRVPLLRDGEGGEARPAGAGEALGRLASRLRGARAIGIASPRASLEANYALRALVGGDNFFLGFSERERDLTDLALELLRDPRTRVASLQDLRQAEAVLVAGEDLTNTAPMADLAVRIWDRLRWTDEERRLHITRWNDAAIGRLKRRESKRLCLLGLHATKLDELAAQTLHAAPDELARVLFAAAAAVDGRAAAAVDGGGDATVDSGGDAPDADAAVTQTAADVARDLVGAERTVVVAGASAGSEALLRGAAQLVWALGERARLLLVLPEPNSLGLALLGGRRLSEAFAAVVDGMADTALVLDNDLYRRAEAAQVDEFFSRCEHTVALASIADDTTSKATSVLPAGTWAESTGTYVSAEGRAQRFFAVFAPGDEIRDPWRWLRELLVWLDRPEGRAWTSVDEVLAAIAEELPQLAGARDAAPGAGFRLAGGRVARQPVGFSGRTAQDAQRTVQEPPPVEDLDSPLAFSLEGVHGPLVPAPLLTDIWSPGWNSVNSVAKFQQEANGPLHGGPSGVRLFAAEGTPAEPPAFFAADRIPPAFVPREDEWLIVPLYHIYGSEPLSRHTPGVAERAPGPYVALSPAEAETAGFFAGQLLTVTLPSGELRLPLRLVDGLAQGVAGLPAGLAGLPYVALPAFASLAPETPERSARA